MTSGGGGGGGGEGVSNVDIVLSADERKRAGIGRGGVASRWSFGDHKRQPKRRPW